MDEFIIKEDKSAPLDLSKKSGIAKWLSGHSGGLITEKSSALIILAAALLLVIYSVYTFIMARPKIDTHKDYQPVEMD